MCSLNWKKKWIKAQKPSLQVHLPLVYWATDLSKYGSSLMALYRSRGYLELNPSFTLTPAKTPFLFIFRFVPSIRTRCLLNYSSISLKGKPTIRNCCVTPPQMYVYPDPIPQFAQDVRITLFFPSLVN